MFDARLLFPAGRQRQFLEQVATRLQGDWAAVARLCHVHQRTLYDWRREKYSVSAAAADKIRRILKIRPQYAQRVEAYRHMRLAGRKGALARYRLYGNPGTTEGRRKGGETTQRDFRRNPRRAAQVGFVVRQRTREPAPCEQLAEFIGIMLGDGHLGAYQALVYFNSTERRFAVHVQRLVEELFGVTAPIRQKERHCLELVISRRHLVEYLERVGLRRGNKIHNRVSIPAWILQRQEYMAACLRGLMDTDGGLFSHHHATNGHRYRHYGLCFTSYSPPLLQATHRLFRQFGYAPRLFVSAGHVFLYRKEEVARYMATIGTRHPHRMARFQELRERSRSG